MDKKKRTITKKLGHPQNPKPIHPAAHPHLKKKEPLHKEALCHTKPPDTRPPLQPTLSLSSPSPDFPSTDQRAAAPPLLKKKNIFFSQVSHQRAPPFLHLSHLPPQTPDHSTNTPFSPIPAFFPLFSFSPLASQSFPFPSAPKQTQNRPFPVSGPIAGHQHKLSVSPTSRPVSSIISLNRLNCCRLPPHLPSPGQPQPPNHFFPCT